MGRENSNSNADYIGKALNVLERCRSEKAPRAGAGSDGGVEPGEALLRKLGFLLDDRHKAGERLERVERELAVFREVNSETSRLLERKIEEISLLRLITDTTSRAIMSQDPFKPMLDKVTAIVGADNGFIILLNPETGRFEVRAASGGRNSELDDSFVSITEKIAGRVASSGEPCLINDTHTDPHFALLREKDYGIRSLISFPLIVEEKMVGVLNVSSPHTNAFGDETKRIMYIIAGQIAIAVQNARLYKEVRNTKEYLENLVERAGDAIFTLDRSHEIVSWNKGAEAIFMRDKESALEATIYDLVTESASPMLREQIQTILDFDSIAAVEIDSVRGDGKITQIALTLSPIHGADGEVIGVSGIAKDITERKRVEEELRRLNEAKTNFVSTVSHELRTPLTSIKSFTEILLHDMTSLSEDTVIRYLNLINEECDRLSGLISSLLDLQKMNAGRLEPNLKPVFLFDLVQQATELFDSVALQNRIELSAEFLAPKHMTRILGDRKRLMQILSNLLSNALKYVDTGGHVQVVLARENEVVKLTITDDGIGIPDGEKDKVFDKFYQVENAVTRAKGGTGLGLAITRELVALHDGWIWVESRGGKGCTFCVLIPAVE